MCRSTLLLMRGIGRISRSVPNETWQFFIIIILRRGNRISHAVAPFQLNTLGLDAIDSVHHRRRRRPSLRRDGNNKYTPDRRALQLVALVTNNFHSLLLPLRAKAAANGVALNSRLCWLQEDIPLLFQYAWRRVRSSWWCYYCDDKSFPINVCIEQFNENWPENIAHIDGIQCAVNGRGRKHGQTIMINY